MTVFARLTLLKSFAFAAFLLIAATLGAGRAEAAVSNCSISSSGVTFSAYNTVTRAAVDAAGTISVTCSGSGVENLSLNLTGGNSGSCSPRQMRQGAASLGYQIYREASRVSNFCDGGSRLDIVFDFSSGSPQTNSYTMYGRVTANQNPSWGSYSDSLAITLKKGGGSLATGTAPINGSVSPVCSVSAGTLGFGTYAPATGTNSTATISVNCSNGAPYQVSLGGGQNLTGSTRRMSRAGPSYLSYFLYSDSNRTIAWGDGSALGARVSATGTGGAQSRTVYGRVPAGQAPSPGSYSDSVIVTVEY